MTKKITRRSFIKSSAAGLSLVLPAYAAAQRAGRNTGRVRRANPRPLAAYDDRVRQLLTGMTLEEKVGQMTQAEITGLKDEADVGRYFLGSLLSGGNGDPKTGNGLKDWTDMYDGYQALALRTRLAIPLLY